MGQSGPISDIPGNFFVAALGSTAAIASNGAGAILTSAGFRAPAAIKVLSVYKIGLAAEVTKGTATTSASYRRHNLVNAGTAGTGTTIVASLNNTYSGAANVAKAFATTANNTLAAGEVAIISHLTVGADTGDGTDAAASVYSMSYQLL